MKKAVLVHGICGGRLIALSKLIEYRFLVVEHSPGVGKRIGLIP